MPPEYLLLLPEDSCTWRQNRPVCFWTWRSGSLHLAFPTSDGGPGTPSGAGTTFLGSGTAFPRNRPANCLHLKCTQLTRLEHEVLPRTGSDLPLLMWQDFCFLLDNWCVHCGIAWLNPKWMIFKVVGQMLQTTKLSKASGCCLGNGTPPLTKSSTHRQGA